MKKITDDRDSRAIEIAKYEGLELQPNIPMIQQINEYIDTYSSYNGLMPIIARINQSNCEWRFISMQRNLVYTYFNEKWNAVSYEKKCLIDVLQEAIIYYYKMNKND